MILHSRSEVFISAERSVIAALFSLRLKKVAAMTTVISLTKKVGVLEEVVQQLRLGLDLLSGKSAVTVTSNHLYPPFSGRHKLHKQHGSSHIQRMKHRRVL